MKTEYTLEEKIKYFEELLQKELEKSKVLEAKLTISHARVGFLAKKLRELRGQIE